MFDVLGIGRTSTDAQVSDLGYRFYRARVFIAPRPHESAGSTIDTELTGRYPASTVDALQSMGSSFVLNFLTEAKDSYRPRN